MKIKDFKKTHKTYFPRRGLDFNVMQEMPTEVYHKAVLEVIK